MVSSKVQICLVFLVVVAVFNAFAMPTADEENLVRAKRADNIPVSSCDDVCPGAKGAAINGCCESKGFKRGGRCGPKGRAFCDK